MRIRAVTIVLLLAVALLKSASDAYDYFLSGNAADVQTRTSAGFLLAGGGATPPEAWRWFIGKAAGGDAVVLRASGGDAMNRVLRAAGPVDSVETIVFKAPEAARDPFVLERIRNAEALFFAGGDQSNYVRMWKGNGVAAAIQSVIAKAVRARASRCWVSSHSPPNTTP